MNDEGDRAAKTITKVVAGGIGAASGALVTGPVMSAAAGSLATSSIEVAINAFSTFRSRRAEAWWRDYIRNLGTLTPEGAVTEAKLRASEDSAFQERIFHSLNAVWAAVDESVLPSLAFLAADYHARGKPADVFFKRCARFLQETTEAELKLLRFLLDHVEQAFATRTGKVMLEVDSGDSRIEIGTAEEPDFLKIDAELGVEVLLRRLADEYLVDHGDLSDGVAVSLGRDSFDRLVRYVARPIPTGRGR